MFSAPRGVIQSPESHGQAQLDPRWGIINFISPQTGFNKSASGVISAVPGPQGLAMQQIGGPTAGVYTESPGLDIAGRSEFTLFLFWTYGGYSSETLINCEFAPSSAFRATLYLYNNAFTFGHRDSVTGDGGGLQALSLTSPTNGATYAHVATYSAKNSNKQVFANGVSAGSASTRINAMSATAGVIHLGSAWTGNSYYTPRSKVYFCGVADRVWTPAEIAEFSQNPWSIFRVRSYAPTLDGSGAPQVAVNGSFSITARLRGSVSYAHIDSSLSAAAVLGGAGKVWYNAIVTDGSLQALVHLNGDAHPQYQFRVNPVEVRRLLRVERRQLSEVTDVLRMIPEGD